jgi:hypothetical protein
LDSSWWVFFVFYSYRFASSFFWFLKMISNPNHITGISPAGWPYVVSGR